MQIRSDLKNIDSADLVVVVLETSLEICLKQSSKDNYLSVLPDQYVELIKKGIKSSAFKPEWGSSVSLSLATSKQLVSLVVLGLNVRSTKRELELGAKLASLAKNCSAQNVVLVASHALIQSERALSNIVQGIKLGEHSFDRYHSKSKSRTKIKELRVQASGVNTSKALIEGLTISSAINLARDLINTPASDCTPKSFVALAKKLADRSGVKVRVLDRAALTRMGAGGILAVSKASAEPPYLLILDYVPSGANKKTSEHLALVGKGITFDSGGLSIKTGEGMETMKDDMSGAAAVLATILSLKALKINRAVRGYIPLAENMISNNAMRPGDVIRFVNGKTTEVLNTDAEGRLVLADALSLAVREGAKEIIDLATLTGACIVALGMECAALYANNDSLAFKLLEAAKKAGESLWRMPLFESYRAQLDSPIADLKNIGNRSLGAGSITAALFLQEFVAKETHWAHLDIAGPAYSHSESYHIKKGGVGFGITTLLEYLKLERSK